MFRSEKRYFISYSTTNIIVSDNILLLDIQMAKKESNSASHYSIVLYIEKRDECFDSIKPFLSSS